MYTLGDRRHRYYNTRVGHTSILLWWLAMMSSHPSHADRDLLERLRTGISGSAYFDPIADPPTQEIRAMGIGIHHVRASRYPIASRSPWPLEHMFAAVCNHLRQRAPIPKYIVLPREAYAKHLQDVLTPRPFDGLFPFQISSMERPFFVLVRQDGDFNMKLPIDTILCIN